MITEYNNKIKDKIINFKNKLVFTHICTIVQNTI